MSKEYEALSRFYDDIICDEQYDSWLNFLVKTLKDKNPAPHGIDFACGTGLFTRKIKLQGYDVVGVDLSPEMLAVAEEKTRNEKLNIKYFVGDYKKFRLKEKQGFITIINDGLNYVDEKGLKKALLNAYDNLLEGGILIFDVSTKYKLKCVLGENMYGDDGEELSYLWLNEFKEDKNKLDMSLTFFKRKGDVYERFNEFQTQYAHDDYLLKLVEETGFKILSKTDENGNEFTEKSLKYLFVLQK